MVARGRVQNGVVVLAEDVHLPEGTEVLVTAVPDIPGSPAAVLAAVEGSPQVPAEWVDELDRLIAEGRRPPRLTPEQLRALDAPEQPTVAVDPRTGQEYLLIRRDVYEKVRAVLKPFGRAWDNPADEGLIAS